jgi:hypothetical protein
VTVTPFVPVPLASLAPLLLLLLLLLLLAVAAAAATPGGDHAPLLLLGRRACHRAVAAGPGRWCQGPLLAPAVPCNPIHTTTTTTTTTKSASRSTRTSYGSSCSSSSICRRICPPIMIRRGQPRRRGLGPAPSTLTDLLPRLLLLLLLLLLVVTGVPPTLVPLVLLLCMVL